MAQIDLNSDIGESFGSYTIGNDEEILKYVTSVNIACGFHAGDPLVMQKTVKRALENNVAVGAHPGLPDLIGFGRRTMQISTQETQAYVIYQLGALQAFLKVHGGKMQHVKPHGALYNMAINDYELARAIAEGVYSVDKGLILVGLAGSELLRAGQDAGLHTASEVFADRAYTNKGTLVPRQDEGAVIHNVDEAVSRALKMVMQGKVDSIDGVEIRLQADTICVHGDTKEAVRLVKSLKKALQAAGVKTAALR